jgi:hypothetical protein
MLRAPPLVAGHRLQDVGLPIDHKGKVRLFTEANVPARAEGHVRWTRYNQRKRTLRAGSREIV